MRKVIKILYPFVGDTVGGSHISALALIRALDRERFEPVIMLHVDGRLGSVLREQNIPYTVCDDVSIICRGTIKKELSNMVCLSLPVCRLLHRLDVDVVHTNDQRMHLTWALGARMAGCGFVWHQRTGDDSRRNAVYSRLAHRVVTISDYCKSIMPNGMRRRAEVLYNPFEIQDDRGSRNLARERLLAELVPASVGARGQVAVVGFVGNLQDQKRPTVFLEVARYVAAAHAGLVVFPMFGEKRPDVLARIQHGISVLGLEERVVIMGQRVPIAPWISGCDVIVAPAINEGFGRVLVESMMVGTPVVASDHSGHREVIKSGQTGFLAKAEDPEDMASCVLKLLGDAGLCVAISDAAYADVCVRFSADIHVSRMTHIYTELASAV